MFINKPIEEVCHAIDGDSSNEARSQRTDAGAVMDTIFFIGQIGALLCLFYGGVLCITHGTTAHREPGRKKPVPFGATRDGMESD